MTIDDNKRKALTSALGQIEKQFGKGAIMRMGDRVNEAIETVSTGSGWISRWASAACRAAAWWKSTGRSRRVKPR
jgi:hypothetical protein